jgi:CheY-like chemotaxis protein
MTEREERHVAAVCEDNPAALEVICDTVASLNHEPVPLATLDEIKDFLASGREPCYWLQDMQMPHGKGARPHEKVGETSTRMVRARSSGKHRIPIIVLTAFRNDPAFVMNAARLGADDFIEKANMPDLGDAILRWLKERGREDHASCAACNASSREAEAMKPEEPKAAAKPVARLFSHEQKVGWRSVTEAEVRDVVARRKALHLFVNALTEERDGFLASRLDVEGRYREVFLQRTQAEILVELAAARQAVRPSTMKCLKRAGLGQSSMGAVRLVEQARNLVDVNPIVGGRVSRRRWRAIHTGGEKDLKTFWFDPPPDLRWAVLSALGE